MQQKINFKNKNPKVLINTTDDGDVLYYNNFFEQEKANTYLANLLEEINWKEEEISMFGKRMKMPRLTAWYGDSGKTYTYSGITNTPLPWTKTLLIIKNEIEQVSATKFNSVLLNLYRDGSDSMSWHSDDERELGDAPVIGSVSFGATRRFMLKHKTKKLDSVKVDLENGSFLLMKGLTQTYWKHQVPKTKRELTNRINLTFRVIT